MSAWFYHLINVFFFCSVIRIVYEFNEMHKKWSIMTDLDRYHDDNFSIFDFYLRRIWENNHVFHLSTTYWFYRRRFSNLLKDCQYVDIREDDVHIGRKFQLQFQFCMRTFSTKRWNVIKIKNLTSETNNDFRFMKTNQIVKIIDKNEVDLIF